MRQWLSNASVRQHGMGSLFEPASKLWWSSRGCLGSHCQWQTECLWSPQIHLLKYYSPKLMVLGGRACGRALMNEISALTYRTTESILASSQRVRAWWEVSSLPPGRGFSLDTTFVGALILDFAASRTVRNTYLVFKLPILYGIFFFK